MRKNLTKGFLAALLLGSTSLLNAQTVDVDRTKYPDYSTEVNPDWSLIPSTKEVRAQSRGRAVSGRPDHVHNGLNRHFPPVFNQDGGSCGSASRICYMFSYELAAYRNLDGKDPHNYYPSHFVWLHTNSPGAQGKDDFVTKVGVPSAATYGGQTYSSFFGYQEESNNDFGWMQGYDKWYEAMHNRMLRPSNFPVNVGTEEGREAVKNWLWNHNGDDSFQAGGICGIGVASGGDWQKIPSTETNDAAGVTGMYFVNKWGTSVDHALTIVGYDDRIEFDLDKDGIYGEREADELGAWIIVNSWGGWCNGGFIYCPYAHGVPAFNGDGSIPNNFWTPEVYKVRKDYRPLRTIKLEMDYSRRSEIALKAGISADLNATEPEKSVDFVHFTYAGDGNRGESNPAPEIPMLGRWADGELHTEPMEFGYDLTDLSAEFDMSQPLKYFFVVDTRSWAQGKGTIHGASIIDYRFNELGIETPFNVGEGIEIRNAGEKTIISVIVQGSGYYKPQNVAYADGALSWQAPLAVESTVVGYDVVFNGNHVAALSADTRSYTPKNAESLGDYGVSAVYSDGGKSECVVTRVPLVPTEENVGINYNKAGFTIPDVMASHYDEATIEFWLKPSQLAYWSHSGGGGLNTFFFYATQHGQYSAGWNSGDFNDGYVSTYNAPLAVNKWSHVAIVVEKNVISIYVNGTRLGQRESSKYSGIGGFGNLVFASNESIAPNGAQHGVYDEVRVWNVARTKDEIVSCMYTEFTGSVMPRGLVSYLRGDLIVDADGTSRLYDYAGGHHASLMGSYEVVSTNELGLGTSRDTLAISIDEPQNIVYAGIPVTLTATYNTAVTRMAWTADGAGVENIAAISPTMTFATAGTYTVNVTAYAADGTSTMATRDIIVAETPEVEPTFSTTPLKAKAGERITFHADNPQVGYSYRWSLPGADDEEGTSSSVATLYHAKGVYNVTLTVVAPDGKEKSNTKQIEVLEVAPKAAFGIAPAVIVKGEEVNISDESLYAPTQWKWHLGNTKNNYIIYDQYKTLLVDNPGVYDVTLTVANAEGYDKLTRKRAFIVTNADSKNGLNFSYDNASVATATGMSPIKPGQSAFTIDWWMNSAVLDSFGNGIGESEQTMLLKANGQGEMTLSVGGRNAVSDAGLVVPGEWHHYAVTYASGTVRFYRDGMLVTTKNNATASSVPVMNFFSIGLSSAPFKGSIDELRVWSKTLTEEQLRSYANSPIVNVAAAESNHGLELYYDFNQNGGDVQDATSNGYHGSRTGFGPDGDAWGLSKGVFCLNFDKTASSDVTATYLTNYEKSFDDNGECVNPNLSARTFSLTDWKLENTVTNGNTITGAHVDYGKSRCMTLTTAWDGFANTLYNHKVFQTITLPAGYYTFEVMYDTEREGQCGASYLVASKGNTLPVTADLDQAIAYTAMVPKGQVMSNSVGFAVTEETTVSIGLLVNMSGSTCMALQRFTLTRSDVEIFEKSSDALSSIANLSNDRLYYISLPYHTRGLASWAIAQGSGVLKSNVDLAIKADRDDTMQQFAILSNDEGATHYLYHAAEKMFVGKEGQLTDTPVDPVYFKEGAYDTTYVAYFDETHYINVDNEQQMTIDDYTTPDGGNSVIIRPAKSFNPKAALAKFPIVAVTDIELNHSEVTLMAGDAVALQATIAPTYATDPTVTWSTSDNSVAIVVRGVVTAVAPGKATITAKADDVEATCVVTVEKRYVAVMGVIMSQITASVTEGETLTLTATVTPADADVQTVDWETSDAAIATVKDGVVTALMPGTVVITAKAEGREGRCYVTVKKRYVPVTEILLNYTKLELEVGDKAVALKATPLPEDADNKKVTWSTSNRNVAKVLLGRVTAVSPGEAIITAETVDCKVTCVVTVKEPTSVELTPVGERSLNIYDVAGRPVRLNAKSTEGLEPGTYIINGRKVVIK